MTRQDAARVAQQLERLGATNIHLYPLPHPGTGYCVYAVLASRGLIVIQDLGSARLYRAGLVVTEDAGDSAYHRGHEDFPLGRCRVRSVRQVIRGRGHLPGRAVCAASDRRPSVNRMTAARAGIPIG